MLCTPHVAFFGSSVDGMSVEYIYSWTLFIPLPADEAFAIPWREAVFDSCPPSQAIVSVFQASSYTGDDRWAENGSIRVTYKARRSGKTGTYRAFKRLFHWFHVAQPTTRVKVYIRRRPVAPARGSGAWLPLLDRLQFPLA